MPDKLTNKDLYKGLTREQIRKLIEGVQMCCSSPRGRFGEDGCGVCKFCKLMEFLHQEDSDA